MKNNLLLIFLFLLIALPLNAHTFTGMVGFYDGLSHPVLGMDHFLAMISVGIISAQIGGKEIWTIPISFVVTMVIGGIIGMIVEINYSTIENHMFNIVEYGIIFSVIFLGLAIAFEKKLPLKIIFVFIAFFGLCHGIAHGMEMPWASNPILFALGFTSGTATLHLFGVGIGNLVIKNKYFIYILRIMGLLSACYGMFLFT